jgi:hypothetical protein
VAESVIAVPIHLDALVVNEPSGVAPPMADFTRLPFFDGQRDVNPQTPWLGEAAANEPFSSDSLLLRKGIHLHWRFPKALTTGFESANGKIAFPSLPDRWFLTRGREINGARVAEDQWVIESDYLHPDGVVAEGAAYPLLTETTGRCYRYMGRVLPWSQWRRGESQAAERLNEPLSAIGYGEPSFASFYPNCSRQFGFHDPRFAGQIPDGLFYQVVGWYSNREKDFLQFLLKEPFDRRPGEDGRARLARILKDRLQWSVAGDPPVDVQLVCEGSLMFRPKPDLVWTPHLETPKVTFGATITEALSAHLANEVAAGDTAKKAAIEDQLEAIMLDRTLSERSVDLAEKFKEARHEKGFDEAYAGVLWTVRAEAQVNEKDDPDLGAAPWPDIDEKLGKLNGLQHAYNIAWDEIRSLRRRLYSDWSSYMNASYPSPDAADSPKIHDLRLLIQEQSLPELNRKIADAGLLDLARRDPDAAPPFSETKPFSLARQIAQAFAEILQSLRTHERETGGKARYLVQPAVAPRFWRPTEPVILIAGKMARLDEPAHLEDLEGAGLLPCELLYAPADLQSRFWMGPRSIFNQSKNKPRVWSEQPWHPFLLQWEVELTPFLPLSNLTTPDRDFDEKFIVRNFTLKRSDVDLSPKTMAGKMDDGQPFDPQPDAFIYRGSSLLTPHVADQFLSHLSRFLDRLGEQESEASGGEEFPFGDVIVGPGDERARRTVDILMNRLKKNPPNGLTAETVERLGNALKQIEDDNFFCLAQRLSGFNEALLLHRQTLRIPIRSPIGFEEDRALARRVEAAIDGEGYYAPQSLKYFSPIRAGELRVKRLRVVSTFGRQMDFEVQSVVTATPMQTQMNRAASVYLPPRLAQPAKLQFRWLAAERDAREMNAHPESTPVCGWVIRNDLDNNLFVYSSGGQALGYMQAEAKTRVRWRPAPGAADPVVGLDRIENPHLHRMVAFFLKGSGGFFDKFLEDLKEAQVRIEPENMGDPLPMGQPLALVRATLSLELQGLPAIQRRWAESNWSNARPGSDSNGFTAVRFPIRLGEQDQLNDGLTVYWLENEDGSYQDNAYIIPSYCEDAKPEEKKCDFLYQSIDAPPLIVTMLVDPRGLVHAATGILPIKAIQIPPHQYAGALKQFEMAFLHAPVLAGRRAESGQDTIALPVTDPPGYEWAWIEKRRDGWISPDVNAADLFRPFAGATEIREGWLKLAPAKKKDEE